MQDLGVVGREIEEEGTRETVAGVVVVWRTGRSSDKASWDFEKAKA